MLACGGDLELVVFDHALYRLLIFTVCFEVYEFCICAFVVYILLICSR